MINQVTIFLRIYSLLMPKSAHTSERVKILLTNATPLPFSTFPIPSDMRGNKLCHFLLITTLSKLTMFFPNENF